MLSWTTGITIVAAGCLTLTLTPKLAAGYGSIGLPPTRAHQGALLPESGPLDVEEDEGPADQSPEDACGWRGGGFGNNNERPERGGNQLEPSVGCESRQKGGNEVSN